MTLLVKMIMLSSVLVHSTFETGISVVVTGFGVIVVTAYWLANWNGRRAAVRLAGGFRDVESARAAADRRHIWPVVNNRRRDWRWGYRRRVGQSPWWEDERAWRLAGDGWIWVPVDGWIDGDNSAATTIGTVVVVSATTAPSIAGVVQVDRLVQQVSYNMEDIFLRYEPNQTFLQAQDLGRSPVAGSMLNHSSTRPSCHRRPRYRQLQQRSIAGQQIRRH